MSLYNEHPMDGVLVGPVFLWPGAPFSHVYVLQCEVLLEICECMMVGALLLQCISINKHAAISPRMVSYMDLKGKYKIQNTCKKQCWVHM